MKNKSQKKGISTGVKVGLIAIAINIITVIVYIYQANLMQRQLHATVWPYIEWRIIYNQNDGLMLKVSNNGVGPALIKKVAIQLDDKSVSSLDSLGSMLLGTKQFPHLTSIVQNRVLPAGESINIISTKSPEWAELLFIEFNKRAFVMEICYESIYGDQWVCTGTEVKQAECK